MSPADPPHGIKHSKLSALLEAHAALEFEVASDMLTRTTKTDDVAPDASVFPAAPDPETGGRQLEQLAFEVVSTQSLGDAAIKAAKLARRGVRRVFAIDLEHARALEWSAALGTWSVLDVNSSIEDPALEAPLPIDALVNAAKVDDAMAQALLTKRNPVLEAALGRREAAGEARGLVAGEARGLAAGESRGLVRALLSMLAARGVVIGDAERERIASESDPTRLERWVVRIAAGAALEDILDG